MTVTEPTRAVYADVTTATPTKLLRTAQVAELLDVSQGAVTKMARAGVLPGLRTMPRASDIGRGMTPGGRWRSGRLTWPPCWPNTGRR